MVLMEQKLSFLGLIKSKRKGACRNMKHSKDITLLLVEDDDVDALTIERSFSKQRIANPIVRAVDGIQALQLLNQNMVQKPYIILLDLRLPRMGGVEFLELLRKDPVHSDAVVFILTTSEAEQDIEASYKNNVAGYFVKGKVGEQFIGVVDMLESYWKVVQLP